MQPRCWEWSFFGGCPRQLCWWCPIAKSGLNRYLRRKQITQDTAKIVAERTHLPRHVKASPHFFYFFSSEPGGPSTLGPACHRRKLVHHKPGRSGRSSCRPSVGTCHPHPHGPMLAPTDEGGVDPNRREVNFGDSEANDPSGEPMSRGGGPTSTRGPKKEEKEK